MADFQRYSLIETTPGAAGDYFNDNRETSMQFIIVAALLFLVVAIFAAVGFFADFRVQRSRVAAFLSTFAVVLAVAVSAAVATPAGAHSNQAHQCLEFSSSPSSRLTNKCNYRILAKYCSSPGPLNCFSITSGRVTESEFAPGSSKFLGFAPGVGATYYYWIACRADGAHGVVGADYPTYNEGGLFPGLGGSYSCSHRHRPINECITSSALPSCHPNAECVDPDQYRPGSALMCRCRLEYHGDGETCAPDPKINLRQGTGGTLRAELPAHRTRLGLKSVRPGTQVNFVADPDDGYYVSGWTGCAQTRLNIGGHSDGGTKECAAIVNADLTVAATFADIDECETSRNNCHADAMCGDRDNPNADPTCTCPPEKPEGDGFAVSGGGTGCLDPDDYELTEVEFVAPSRRPLTATPEAGSGCHVLKWTGACKNARGDGRGNEVTCRIYGRRMVTVGVVFACDKP